MKRLILCTLFILSAVLIPVTAQESCDVAAGNATAILDSALTLLQAGNTQGATTLITTARDMLATCVAQSDNSLSPQATATETEAVATAPDTTDLTTTAYVDDATTGIGDYSLTVPQVDITSGIAFVRFAHTSIDSGAIDLYRERETQPIVAGLDYGEVTELIPIPAGNWLFTARPAGTGDGGATLGQNRWNYASNSSWAVTAAGIREDSTFVIEPISIIRNDYNGKARVRIVNLAAGAPRTTVTTTQGIVLGDGLGWAGLRDNMLDAGDYILQAETSNGSQLITPQTFNFAANQTYTVIVMGGLNADPLTLLPFATPQELSRVRFINRRIDVLDLHYRPGNELLVGTFDPQTETDWFVFPSGAVTFVAVEPGAGPFGRELGALPWQLRPGRDVTVEITQNGMRVTDVVLRGYEN